MTITAKKKKHFLLFFITLLFCTLKAQATGFTYLDDLLFEARIQNLMHFELFQVALWKWLGLLLGLTVSRFFIRYILTFLEKYLNQWIAKTQTTWDDHVLEALRPSNKWLLACLFWFLWIHLFNVQGSTLTFLLFLIKVVLCLAILTAFYRLTDIIVDFSVQWMNKSQSLISQQMAHTLKRALKILVVVFGILVALQNLGINVVSVMAGLGLGGLAFALAAKDMCSHFFGSIMIFLDQPFQVGDWVIIGSVEGTVEDIGFRSTRIRTFYDSLVVIPNGDLSTMNIDNMGRRKMRRMKAFYSVTYDTPSHKIEAFIEGIKDIIRQHPYTNKEKLHVVFQSYKESSLDVMLYCFLEVPSWGQELIVNQEIHLAILKLAEKLTIDFAFPTRTLHINSAKEIPN